MDNKNIFNSSRLKFARKRRGFTIKYISQQLGITTKSYSNYEKNKTTPRPKIITLMAEILSFQPEFFFLDDIQPICESSVSFRSLSRMSAKVRDQALHVGKIAVELSNWLNDEFLLPKHELYDLRDFTSEAAAATLRNEWMIGERPIKNMVHLLEAKGVRIFTLSEETHDFDAFSFWIDQTPFIFLNTKKSVERSRFDAAHELGHLVLHKNVSSCGKEAETAANRFASSFLMAQGSVIARSSRFVNLNWLISAKPYWRVSAAALARRLKDLELITEWQYRTLNVELSQRGYLKNEPNPIKQRELSKLFPMILKALRKDNVGVHDIADDLGVYPNEINTLLFNLAITISSGGSKHHSNIGDRKPTLRIVK